MKLLEVLMPLGVIDVAVLARSEVKIVIGNDEGLVKIGEKDVSFTSEGF